MNIRPAQEYFKLILAYILLNLRLSAVVFLFSINELITHLKNKFKHMPKTRQQKEQVLADLEDKLSQAKGATLTAFSGLTVSADQSLRRELRANEVTYSVVKKTLLIRAFNKMGLPSDFIKDLEGNISLAICQDDEVASAKAVSDFVKSNESMNIVGGIMDNKWIDADKVKELAKLPSKLELIATTVATIKAPITGFVNVLAGNVRGLVSVLNAIKEQKL